MNPRNAPTSLPLSHKRKRTSATKNSIPNKKSKTRQFEKKPPPPSRISLLDLPPVILNDIIEYCLAPTDAQCYRIEQSTKRRNPHLPFLLSLMRTPSYKPKPSLSKTAISLQLACKLINFHVKSILLREIHLEFRFTVDHRAATFYSSAKLDPLFVRKLCIRASDSTDLRGWNWALSHMEMLGLNLINVRVIELRLGQEDKLPWVSTHRTPKDYLRVIFSRFPSLAKVELSVCFSHTSRCMA